MMHRTQTRLVLVLLVAVGVLALGLGLYQRAERARVHRFFAQQVEDENSTLDKLLELKGAPLQMFAVDYIYWDEMVQCIRVNDLDWADEQVAEALGTYQAQVAWLLRPDRSLVHFTYSEKEASLRGFTLPADALAQLGPQGRFWHFFIPSPEGPVEVRAATVHPSSDPDRQTQQQRYFLVARSWNRQYLAELSQLAGRTMRIDPARAGAEPSQGVIRQSGEVWCTHRCPVRWAGPRWRSRHRSGRTESRCCAAPAYASLCG